MWQDVENSGSAEIVNIFGGWKIFWRFSPFNCSPGFTKIPCSLFSLAVFFAMLFRIYWLLFRTNCDFLTLGWSEANLYAFLTFESFSLLIAISRMTSVDSVNKLEKNIGIMKMMRIKPHHEKLDNYKGVHFRLFLWLILIGVSILGSAVYLLANKLVIFGTTQYSTWYPTYDFIISIFCFYVHFLYLPIHILLHSAIRREIDVFNIELEESLDHPDLQKSPELLQKFADRQLILQNFTNFTISRFNQLLNNASFLILVAVLNGSYITSVNSSDRPLLYFFCNLFLSISTIVITSMLLYPQAMINEAMQKTSRILMSSKSLQENSEVSQIMIQRSRENRHFNNIAHVYRITRKNIERTFLFFTVLVLVMNVTHQFIELGDAMGEFLKDQNKPSVH
ncbi:unnamed protein product [Caenorhabditis angaria]|uniref:Gustatory receptor n=1 Tax=Caenorhabditis angaria TaxID=860376 RepID=A0A9P1N773_9PELO|nr:unnamed protein product [Caenorhabditis angaria]